jgi:hypothetical protein
MKTKKPKKTGRGGARKGAGRPINLQKQCQILAVAASFVVSESHARRMLREWGGTLKRLIKASVAKLLEEDWDSIPADEQWEIYEYLRAKVDKHRAEGFTTRL